MTTRRLIIYVLLVLGLGSCSKSKDTPHPTVYHDPRNTTTPSNPAPGPLSYEHAFGQTYEGNSAVHDSMKHYVYYVFSKDSLVQLYDFLITAISKDSASGIQLTHEDFVLKSQTKAIRHHGSKAYDGYFYRFESKEPVSWRRPSSGPIGSYAYQSTIRTAKQQITTYKGFRNTNSPLDNLWQ